MNLQFEILDEQATLNPDKLIFSDRWTSFSKAFNVVEHHGESETYNYNEIPHGFVAAYCADRFGCYDPFVVIKSDEYYHYVVFPRIRYVDGQAILGQDQLTDRHFFDNEYNPNIYNNCNCYKGQGYSECGCITSSMRQFANTFQQSTSTTYTMAKIVRDRYLGCLFYVGLVKDEYLNSIDHPLSIDQLKELNNAVAK